MMIAQPHLQLYVGAILLLVFSVGARVPRVTTVPADSEMESELVQHFKDEGYSEVNLYRVKERSHSGQLHSVFRHKLKTRNPIDSVYIIPPKYVHLNGTVSDYKEGVDFTIRCGRNSVTIVCSRVGYFHMSVMMRIKDRRGPRAISQENMIMSAGMTSSCDNTCKPDDKECKKDDCEHLPRDTIECPPNNNCNIISHDASIYNDSSGPLQQPVGNGVVVKTCDEFISAVCTKFDANGGKVDVYIDAHGNNGFFVIGEYDGPKEYVSKGSNCYNKICAQLKDKISTITLFSCSTAGGDDGATFLQCLANCLNANVKAWKKTLYINAQWNSTNVSSIEWSTPRNYTTPCEATPSVGTSAPTPTHTVTPPTPTPTHTVTLPTPTPTHTTTPSTPTTTHTTTPTTTHTTTPTTIPPPGTTGPPLATQPA